MKHKWVGKATKEASGYKGGDCARCIKCGCVKEIIHGKLTYFLNDNIYEKAPECKDNSAQGDDISIDEQMRIVKQW